MEWPDYVFFQSLFPSLSQMNQVGLPIFPAKKPVWKILDPESTSSLKNQIIKISKTSPADEFVDDCEHYYGITIDESKGPVMIRHGAQIEPGSHFIGPCLIDKFAHVRHAAYVREHSWICSDAVVGHSSEIKHSILLPGAKAPHFNYVGDSILGAGVNLGAGVKLSNLRNDGAEVHIKIGEIRVPSGIRKFGAIIGENCQLGCNAVTNPGTILGRNSAVWPNAVVSGIHLEGSEHR